jgi:hypothetical protein
VRSIEENDLLDLLKNNQPDGSLAEFDRAEDSEDP